jgi:hypothetical protein
VVDSETGKLDIHFLDGDTALQVNPSHVRAVSKYGQTSGCSGSIGNASSTSDYGWRIS